MNMRDLIPWNRGSGSAVASYGGDDVSPFISLHREMNRLFDEAFRGFDSPALFGRMPAWPRIEVTEGDQDIRVAAELPGMDENDVEVMLADGVLTIRGEKKHEADDKERQFSERFYGRFERRIPVDTDVNPDQVSATFKNGLLTVTVPRPAGAQLSARRIPINARSH